MYFRGPGRQEYRKGPLDAPYYLDRPPDRYAPSPKFGVQMILVPGKGVDLTDLDALLMKLKFRPRDWNLYRCKNVVGRLFYEQLNEAVETVVQLWDMVFDGLVVGFVPHLFSKVNVPSEKLELSHRLKVLFLKKLSQLKEGEFLEKWLKEIQSVAEEINRVSTSLANGTKLRIWNELLKKKKGLEAERDLILNRVQEFLDGINCIENYLKNEDNNEEGAIPIFQFSDGEINWRRIYWLIKRECRRLDDGLPIFGRRREILKQIHGQQVTVLVGETGSGKSTQLVQFLADSGIFSDESIVCTQPRKVAASSLTDRINEESHGCYADCHQDTLVDYYHSYSSTQMFQHRVIFMTDNCLLRHHVNDRKLSKVSCIVVDEAHERSLHTDLLLALIKNLLCQRPTLRLIIMSATADADQLAEFFFGCRILHVPGRCYPVEIKYVPSELEGFSTSNVSPYVLDVLKMVTEIDKNEKEGTILAFLTSQMEVEWAFENFHSQSAVVLPLHGKLSSADQSRVFLTYPGKRVVIFATNVAETSLTIPGVKYVVDSGMMIESRFESSSGMNVLKVCRISQSSANQRAGRAGRTEPGTCYRLYTESDFQSMTLHQEPQIRKVHLGVAILKMLAMGIVNIEKFDFVDAPSEDSIQMTVENLKHLGAIKMQGGSYELTAEGWDMVKLGVEPCLAKLVLKSCHDGLGREGLVLAAVMANSGTIFCRVGKLEDKLKSDSLKVQFCHPNGDLFTLLAVYKAWESLPEQKRSTWCWQNSINAKSLKRCREVVMELEACLEKELNIIVPSYWHWNPQKPSDDDKKLKEIILSSLPENVAMYSGYDHLGYEVALTRKYVKLHPSCSLLNFAQRPAWVVFGELLSASNEYLVCVTACEYESLSTLFRSPECLSSMENHRLEKRILSGFGIVRLKRFCGKLNCNLHRLVSSIRSLFADHRIGVEVIVDQNDVFVYASLLKLESVSEYVLGALEYEKRLLENECLIKCLYEAGPPLVAPVALFGAGAEIKHLELLGRFMSVDIFHSKLDALDDKELLRFLEGRSSGCICKVSRSFGIAPDIEMDKWGSVTFLTPDAAKTAAELKDVELCGGLLNVVPSRSKGGGDNKMLRIPPLRASIEWPRRRSKGVAFVTCRPEDVSSMIQDFSNLVIGDRLVWCEPNMNRSRSIVVSRFSKELSEDDVFKVLQASTTKRILSVYLLRGAAVDGPCLKACQDAILKEISPFMPGLKPQFKFVHVQVMEPREKDEFMKAKISFDGDLHLAAASALEQIEGKILPGFDSWQKIKCLRCFRSTVSCSASVYDVIKIQLQALLRRLERQKGVTLHLENRNGFLRVDISARGTRTVAEVRRPLENLMRGRILQHPDITPSLLQILFSRDGAMLLKTTQSETGTRIILERHNMVVRIFGSPERSDKAEQMLVRGVVALHESRPHEVKLRSSVFPVDMMKRVVDEFGPDLGGLKEALSGAELSLNVRRHCLYVSGSKEMKQKVERLILDLAFRKENSSSNSDSACPICLCEVDDSYCLEGCCHKFCRSCLVEQIDSAIRNFDSFPLRCAKEGCGRLILLADFRSLASDEGKMDELFNASLVAYVASSAGKYRFCPSPDCSSVYRALDPAESAAPFLCGACLTETCARCHQENHPFVSCDKYREFKEDPDLSLKEWRLGKENVKVCPCCGFTIEKLDGCHHVECRCGRHVCWFCLESFGASDDCYTHMRALHQSL